MNQTNPVRRIDGDLFIEDVSCASLAQQFGTPLYVYSRLAVENAWRAYDVALAARPHLVCYCLLYTSDAADE